MTLLNATFFSALAHFCNRVSLTVVSLENKPKAVMAKLSCGRSLFIYMSEPKNFTFVLVDDYEATTFSVRLSGDQWLAKQNGH